MSILAIFLILTEIEGGMEHFFTLRCSRNLPQVEVVTDETAADSTVETIPMILPTKATDTPVAAVETNDFDSIRNACMDRYYSVALPLSNLKVSSKFGMRTDPFNHAVMARHNGLDLSTPSNSEVYSMFAGKVLRISYDDRSGNFVTIQHGDYTISFCHLTRAVVKVGDMVKPGDLIAYSGNTGRSTGPHLHLTVRRKGAYVNPAILLNYIFDVRTNALEELRQLIG